MPDIASLTKLSSAIDPESISTRGSDTASVLEKTSARIFAPSKPGLAISDLISAVPTLPLAPVISKCMN